MLHQSRQGRRAPAVSTPTSTPSAAQPCNPSGEKARSFAMDSESVTSSGPCLTRVSACPGCYHRRLSPTCEVGHGCGRQGRLSVCPGNLHLVRKHACVLSRVRVCDPRGCSPPGSCTHGVLQAGILVGLPFPPPGGIPDPGIEPTSPATLALWKRLTILHL